MAVTKSSQLDKVEKKQQQQRKQNRIEDKKKQEKRIQEIRDRKNNERIKKQEQVVIFQGRPDMARSQKRELNIQEEEE